MGRGSGPTEGAMYLPVGYCFGTSWTGPAGGSAPRRTRARRAGFMGPGSIAVPPAEGNARVRSLLSTALAHPPSVESASARAGDRRRLGRCGGKALLDARTGAGGAGVRCRFFEQAAVPVDTLP